MMAVKHESAAPVVVVTGGTSGIGKAVVEAGLAQGWVVVVVDVNAGALAEHRAAAGDRNGIHFLEADVASEAAVERAVEEIERDIGPIGGLVNSAGIGRDIPFLETDTATFRRIMEVNLVGSFVFGRQVATRMISRSRGSIVNIASVSGIMGNAGRVAYGASKGGVITMTRVMAVELAAAGIRVNAVAPGPVETAMVQQMHSPEVRRAWVQSVPQGRYGTAEEIASVIVFLLDDRLSSYVTGQTICADGGFTALGLGRAQ